MKHLVVLLLLMPFFTRAQDTSQTSSALYNETMSVVSNVESNNNIAGNFDPDSVTTLPFGIVKEVGVARYVIAIDSAVFAPGKSFFSAYMALEFPGSTERIAFAAKNVNMNPKGVIPGFNTRLMLVSQQTIHLGPKLSLVLKPDGGNYVEWDCNGFKGVRLKGYFEFDRDLLTPDTLSGGSNTVKATFDVYTNDVHNFIAQVGITPFYIKGLHDVSFSVVDAVIDMSDFQNYPGMVFPQGYNYGAMGGQNSLWTGFYMKQLKIKLPKEISKNNESAEFIATDFLIDKSGVTGKFLANNLFTIGEGKMGKWGFSIDMLGLSFISNTLAGGTLGGKVMLPMSKTNAVAYTASIFHNYSTHKTDYLFTLSPVNDYKADILSAHVDIYPTSKLIVQKINSNFKPSVELNGRISWQHELVETAKIDMQQVIVKDEAPYITSGIFALTDSIGAGSKLSGFRISLNSVTLSVSQSAPVFAFSMGINFTEKEGPAFGAQGSFAVVTKLTPVVTGSNVKEWSFDKILVNDIGVVVHTCAFQFEGALKFKNNDPKYGNGFMASLNLSIDKVLPNKVAANAWFGNTNKFNYYYFDVAVPATVVLVPPGTGTGGLAIYRFMGGLFYHMRPATTNAIAGLYTPAFTNVKNYIPDSTKALAIKAGVTLGSYPVTEVYNGDVALEVIFSSSGGLATMKFSGTAFALLKLSDRVPSQKAPAPIQASFSMLYDHENNIFHAVCGAVFTLPNVSGQGQAEVHFDKDTWYAHIGKPDNRVIISLTGIASIHAYILMGNVIEPIPSPPSQVTDIFGHGFADTRDVNKLQNASGLVFGAWMSTTSNGEFGWSDFSVYYNLGFLAGFDVMAANYGSNAHCSGTAGRAGFNGWFAQGDVYASLWGVVGARGTFLGSDFNVQLLSVSAAALLGGKFPNPSSVKGEVAVNYDFLSVFSGHFDCKFTVGQECTVTN